VGAFWAFSDQTRSVHRKRTFPTSKLSPEFEAGEKTLRATSLNPAIFIIIKD